MLLLGEREIGLELRAEFRWQIQREAGGVFLRSGRSDGVYYISFNSTISETKDMITLYIRQMLFSVVLFTVFTNKLFPHLRS